MRAFFALFILLWLSLPALAQGPVCRTAPPGTSTNNCASEAFVTNSAASAGGGLVSAGTPKVLSIEQMNPGGRLTVASGVCAPNTDQVAQTILYYAPCASEWVPINNGTNMQLYQFTSGPTDTVGLSISLGSNWTTLTLYDVFVGLNSNTVTLCTGPAWSTTGAGTSARGSGAGTTELALYKSLWTNAVSMTCRFSNSSTFTCAVNQCTYLGTVFINAAGQIDLQFGTSAAGCGAALLSIWNQYNRKIARATVADTTAQWIYVTAAFRPADNSTSCKVSFVVGLPDDSFTATYTDVAILTAGGQAFVSIGLNANNAVATKAFTTTALNGAANQGDAALFSHWEDVPPVGLNQIFALERGDGVNNNQFFGVNAPTNLQFLYLSGLM